MDLRGAVGDSRAGPGAALGVSPDEVALVFRPLGARHGPPQPSRMRPDMDVLFAEAADGTLRRDLTLQGDEWWAIREPERSSALPVIFGRKPMVAAAHGGLWIADTDSLVFRMHDGSGIVREFSFHHHPVPARPEWVDQVRDSIRHWMDTTSAPGSELRMRLFESGIPARSTLPAFSDLIGGADGRLWVRESVPPDGRSALWVGVDGSFRPTGRVDVPIDLEVLDFHEGRVLLRRAEAPRVVEVRELGGGS